MSDAIFCGYITCSSSKEGVLQEANSISRFNTIKTAKFNFFKTVFFKFGCKSTLSFLLDISSWKCLYKVVEILDDMTVFRIL